MTRTFRGFVPPLSNIKKFVVQLRRGVEEEQRAERARCCKGGMAIQQRRLQIKREKLTSSIRLHESEREWTVLKSDLSAHPQLLAHSTRAGRLAYFPPLYQEDGLGGKSRHRDR